MGRGRPHSTATVLGELLVDAGMTVFDLAVQSGVHNRTLTEYLAGRKAILPHHRLRIADVLDVDPEELD